MTRPSKLRKQEIQKQRKENPKLKKAIRDKKKESQSKLEAWRALPESEWSEARRNRNVT